MSAEARKNKSTDEGIQAVFLLLPPEGWEAEEWVAAEASRAWSSAGTISAETRKLGEGPEELMKALKKWSRRPGVAVLCTVGRSGHRRGDYAPDVTRSLLDRSLPGVEERMYLSPPSRPADLLFRGAAGIRGETFVLNLPSRPPRVRTIFRFMAPVLGHALEKIAGDEGECAST